MLCFALSSLGDVFVMQFMQMIRAKPWNESPLVFIFALFFHVMAVTAWDFAQRYGLKAVVICQVSKKRVVGYREIMKVNDNCFWQFPSQKLFFRLLLGFFLEDFAPFFWLLVNILKYFMKTKGIWFRGLQRLTSKFGKGFYIFCLSL